MSVSAGHDQAPAALQTSLANGSDSNPLAQIHEALTVVHSPYSSNESRKQASAYLERIKADNAAPYHGFTLASDKSQEAVVSHYALSLLEHAIKHRWSEYSQYEEEAMRGWVLQLSENVSPKDPLFIRNKTAELWVEVAKRSWGSQWLDMDALLVSLWNVPGSVVHKEFVLFVLETLSEEVFNREDGVTAMRETVLSKACVEIFTPAQVLQEAFPNRQVGANVRCGDEGWLVRLGALLDQCIDNDVENNEQYRGCAVKILSVFKSIMPWAIPKAIAAASCVFHISKSLASPSVAVQQASLEALHALYSRTHFTDEEFLTLVSPMYTTERVNLLRKVYEWSIIDPNDIDDEKYLLGKRFSEMMSKLGNFIGQKISSIPEDCDLPNLLNLFFSIVQNQSFVVAIPVLVTWTHLLRSETIVDSPTTAHLIAPLLELCSSRLIRYENLPPDSEDPSLALLVEDIDTIPERHAFLGNYRRYNVQCIELIVRRKTSDAIYHILSQVWHSIEHLYDGIPPFSIEAYSKNSPAILRVDAQFTVVEAALKGYMKWRDTHGSNPQEDEQKRAKMEDDFQGWCERLLGMSFEDPIIRMRALQLAVLFSTSALDKKPNFMLQVLEHVLMTRPVDHPEHRAYSDAVKELTSDSMHELTRLATKMPDHLLEVYDQLEAKVSEIIAAGNIESRQEISYRTFLFIIIHRAKGIDPAVRLERLQSFIAPVKQLWQDPALDASLSSFDGFCDLLGLGKVREYLVSRQVHKIQDWGSSALDDEGIAIQTELTERLKTLPLRPTKSFLGCSTDKIDKGTEPYNTTCSLWHDSVPLMLPGLLKFLGHAHAFHNPANWSGLPQEMQPIVSRILTDRFWQSGISGGSKDDFYARVSGTRTTLEGFASSIRGTVRAVREACYSILYGLSRLNVHFYGFQELPGPLANSLFADAHFLSSHQLINLMTLVRYMVDDCPIELRAHFVPPILATCFRQMDGKISSQWELLGQRQQTTSDEVGLTEEMKEESLLRQLTYTAVMLVASLFDPQRTNETDSSQSATNKEASTYTPGEGPGGAKEWPTMRRFCLTESAILESLILFSTHAIRMRDTRCCGVVLRVFRSIIPAFRNQRDVDPATAAPIREFISTEVLQASITSLHEPYFVELQKDLAQLISAILVSYCDLTNTPKAILMSLPGLQETAVDKCIDYVNRAGVQPRQQRAIVLDLLRDLKGVSISEQGRISKTAAVVRKERSKMQQEFMQTEQQKEESTGLGRRTPELEGLGALFNQ
ncbi:hypothetical protein O988_08891 [Pseudogymnoascus sp. VKM F-3808]|nr:hypothetical protein O988_08891 [Pseudogymnoascus sp. VKM F-3808]